MIKVTRDGQRVVVTVDTDLPHLSGTGTTTCYHFGISMPDVQTAELMKRYIDQRISAAVKDLCKANYDQGFTDGKHHKTRRTGWFQNWI